MTEERKFIHTGEKDRLDRAVAIIYPDISRSRIQKDIELGFITVNGNKVATTKHSVQEGDEIAYQYQAVKPSAAVGMNIPILFENADMLIVDKPYGLPVHPAPGYVGTTLIEELLLTHPEIGGVGEDPIRPGIVHRLDKDTSGAMLVAKNQESFIYLKEAFASRRVHKEYSALLIGNLSEQHGLWNLPIGRHPADFRKMTTENPKESKESLTEFFTIGHFRGEVDEYTQIKVKLHTGRTHQIRVHASAAGYPIAGDKLYGKRASNIAGLDRQFLHSSGIEVQLADGSWIEAHSKLPEDLQSFLNRII